MRVGARRSPCLTPMKILWASGLADLDTDAAAGIEHGRR